MIGITEQNTSISKYLMERYGKELPVPEVLDYKNKLVQFFSLLIEIDQKNIKKEVIKNAEK